MTRSLILAILVGFSAVLTLEPQGVQAQQAAVSMASAQKPLMIIRFNQPKVFWKRPLYTAMSEAIKVAPAVRFNVVAYVPFSGNGDLDEKALGISHSHVQEVTAAMQQMGIPQGQIAISNEMDQSIRHDEIHIFVQ